MRTVQAIRYVTPLREGGSLPAVVECSDGRLVVVKFHGAGQGPRALAAEAIVGDLAAALGLDVPERVVVELDAAFGRNEPDPEIRDLLRASAGKNLGMAFLGGAVTYDPAAPPDVDALAASKVVLLDALTLNVDRTARNPNLLLAGGRLWLIDHGAALYFHHHWESARKVAGGSQIPIGDHVLLPRATRLRECMEGLPAVYRRAVADGLFSNVPDAWMMPGRPGEAASLREAYDECLSARIDRAGTEWIGEWERAQREHV
jgi:hypothetical protein